MGWLIRILLLLLVTYFILSKFEKMFKRMFGNSNGNRRNNRQNDDDLHIDYRSGNHKNPRNKHDFNGGEYVDYEEVDK